MWGFSVGFRGLIIPHTLVLSLRAFLSFKSKNMEVNDKMKKRGETFRKLPVSDWHQIVAFEKIVRNYLKMIEILKKVGVH